MLVVVAALAAIVVALSDVAVQRGSAAARAAREVAARAIADQCLDRATAFALASGIGKRDLDGVLEAPGATPYLVPGSVPVVVPAGAPDPLGVRTWGFARVDGGACLVRFDDNSDGGKRDGSGAFPPAGTTTFDDPLDDRDGGLFATSIGMFPVAADATATDVYAAASTRVTVRRFLGRTGGGASAPTLWAGGIVQAFALVSVCGLGGVTGDPGSSLPITTCICGPSNAPGTSPAHCSGCAVCGPTGPTTAAGPQPDPPIALPETSSSSFRLRSAWFGPPSANAGNPGTNAAWELYFRDAAAPNATASVGGTYGAPANGYPAYSAAGSVDAFAWDPTDDAPSAIAGRTVECVGNAALADGFQTGDRGTCNVAPWSLATARCSDMTADPVPRPCNWNDPTRVVCTEEESPCWKPVQRFNAGGVGNAFAPNNTTAIPNFKDVTLRWDAFNGSCTGCDGLQPKVTVDASGNLTPGHICDDSFPSPAFLAYEGRAGATISASVLYGQGCAGNVPPHVTFLTTTSMTYSTAMAATGALCGDLSTSAACSVAGIGGPESDCIAARAAGKCTVSAAARVVGQLRCDTVEVAAAACQSGGIVAFGGIDAAGGGSCSNGASVNVFAAAHTIGNVSARGSVCAQALVQLDGVIESQADASIANAATVNGQVHALGNIALNNLVKVNDDGTHGASTQPPTASVMWMEADW